MSEITLHNIGLTIKKRRGTDGIKDVAKKIGISSATLSRVENGKLPDLETFPKLCRWLNADGGEILGCSQKKASTTQNVTFHLKAHKNLQAKTANALGSLILVAQEMMKE